MTRLLVLGAGRHQLALIKCAEARGIEVVVSDYYPDAPGKAFATHPTMTSALDVEANIALARRFAVDGVITSGTDQALVTMAEVAAALGLPCALDPDAAIRSTDKRAMRRAYAAAGVRQPTSIEVTGAGAIDLDLPLVAKPSDSQGQRGVARIDEPAELAPAIEGAIAASRSGVAIVEELIEGLELTASAWIENGEIRVLMIADRVTYNPLPAIGICFQHVYPSQRALGLEREIADQLDRVIGAIGASEGPLYVQMLVRNDEVFVVEGTCRVGGGHEASMIPRVAGVDVIGALIELALTGHASPIRASGGAAAAAVTFLFARAGVIANATGLDGVLSAGLALEGAWYLAPGAETTGMVDGQGRVGYLLVAGDVPDEVAARAREAYSRLALTSTAGETLLFWPEALH